MGSSTCLLHPSRPIIASSSGYLGNVQFSVRTVYGTSSYLMTYKCKVKSSAITPSNIHLWSRNRLTTVKTLTWKSSHYSLTNTRCFRVWLVNECFIFGNGINYWWPSGCFCFYDLGGSPSRFVLCEHLVLPSGRFLSPIVLHGQAHLTWHGNLLFWELTSFFRMWVWNPGMFEMWMNKHRHLHVRLPASLKIKFLHKLHKHLSLQRSKLFAPGQFPEQIVKLVAFKPHILLTGFCILSIHRPSFPYSHLTDKMVGKLQSSVYSGTHASPFYDLLVYCLSVK